MSSKSTGRATRVLSTLALTLLLIQGTSAQDDNTAEAQEPMPQLNPSDLRSGQFRVHIDGIEPEGGPTYGETRVLVRGTPFRGLQEDFPKPMCKFGHDDMAVEGTWVNCTDSPHGVEDKEAHHHHERNDLCIQCDNSPAASKAEIIPFTVSLTGDFQDVENSVPYRYYEPCIVDHIYPRYGPKDGQTIVKIWGSNFLNFDQNTRCGFGSKSVQAKYINSTYMECVSPQSDVVQKAIPFTLSLNNQQNSRSDHSFWYYNWPQISKLIPDRGPDEGNTTVIIQGNNFDPFKEHRLKGEIDNYDDVWIHFQRLGPAGYRKPIILNSTKLVVQSPPSFVIRESEVEITLNNQDYQYTDDKVLYHWYSPPDLFDVQPREGPTTGGTRVIAIGNKFKPGPNVTCKFGDAGIVPGKVLSVTEIECFSPQTDYPHVVPLSVSLEMGMYSRPVEYRYYDKPEIFYIGPICGPDYGYTQITVHGKNFVDMGHNKAMCVFNDTIFTNATIMDAGVIKCDSPPLLNKFGYSAIVTGREFYFVKITINGGREIEGPAFKFNYYKDPIISKLEPNRGPTRGGTVSKVTGEGFAQYGACNKTARYSVFEKKLINDTDNDTFIYTESPAANIPDAVVYAVALNGQQFSRDYILHWRDFENTFSFYDDPTFIGYTPKRGPSTGKTPIKIKGFGFMPSKDEENKPTIDRNRMWVRFIDPDTREELAQSSEVAPEQLTEETALWHTPPMPPGTRAILQVSLNNQDWDDVINPNDTHSYEYYAAPHLTKLYPSYGPVKAKNLHIMEIEGTNFECPDENCTDLKVRFGEPPYQGIYVPGTYLNSTFISCPIPKYTKPDVLRVEATFNDEDYTDDGLTYGYYDPYVLNVKPRLISVEGTTKVEIIGFGFVQSNQTKALFDAPGTDKFLYNGEKGENNAPRCIHDAEFIDQNTLLTNTFPQNQVYYKGSHENIMWDPMTVDASVYSDDFTESNVEIYYYEEPDYGKLNTNEAPENVEKPLFVSTDFKTNDMKRLERYSNFTCRFKSEDGKKVYYTKAKMVHYPLDEENAKQYNHIHCKTPKWSLDDKDHEYIKLDIAVNGQDFRGNIDFLITPILKIHRTVPMAGPVQGSNNIRIIGLGYRPEKDNVDLKWGVLRTNVIQKEKVEDYVYHQWEFENMIPGSEELKAYIYEAASFARVDLPMFDSKVYHSIHMYNPQIPVWNRTHGGPYYVEVGKDERIAYKSSKIIINAYNGNDTVNGTVNGTNETTTSIVKSTDYWTYYDYEPSNVEYYWYKDCVVKGMSPHAAVTTGGTLVSVIGAWFKYMPQYGIVPHCKFGDKIVRGNFDSTVRIVCEVPPNLSGALDQEYPFEVSMNGVDFVDTAFKFFYFEEPVIDDIFPDMGPVSGGTPVYLIGQNFTNLTGQRDFNCRFTPRNLNTPSKKARARWLNSTTIVCYSPGGWKKGDQMHVQLTYNGVDYDEYNYNFTFFSIGRAFPRSGPHDGSGGPIIVEGRGFRNTTTNRPKCRLDGKVYEPMSVSFDKILCGVQPSLDANANVPFAVTANGVDWHDFPGGFQYYEQPKIEDIFPKRGPNQGVGIINFYGSGFHNDTHFDIACKLGNSYGIAIVVSNEQMKCVVEDMELTNEGEYLGAQVAMNNYSWTDMNENTYFMPYGVDSIYPSSGPLLGLTDVIVSGKGFVDEGNARCKFGINSNYAIVQGQVLSFDKMVCKTPNEFTLLEPESFPVDIPFSIAFGDDVYDPWTNTHHKFRFYEQPRIISSDPIEVEVGIITEVLVFAEEGSTFFDPVPVNHVTYDEEGSPHSITGLGGIMCKWGRFGETSGVYINETCVKCVTPAVEDDPDSIYRETVTILVALNGQDYDEDSSDALFTFIGTGTYLVFWPFIIGALLVGLLILALVVCCSMLFNSISMSEGMRGGSKPHTENIGGGLSVPKGRSDWNKAGSSVDVVEKASGQNFYLRNV